VTFCVELEKVVTCDKQAVSAVRPMIHVVL